MRAYTFGIYPRPIRLIAATRRDPEGARGMAREESKRILGLQRRAGLSPLSDPLLEWDDMLRWFTAEWEGMEVDGIIRYFEHNAFYRVPIVRGRIGTDGGVLRRHLVVEGQGSATVEVPEPLTFAVMSKDLHYGSVEELAMDIARALNEEICSLEGALKPALVVAKGPALTHGGGPGMAEIAARASGELLRSCSAPGILHLYFKSPLAAYRAFRGLRSSYAGLALDVTRDGPGAFAEELKGYRMDMLALGLVDSHNTKMERAADVAAAAEGLGRAAGVEAMITTSSDLEFIPYSFAVKKLGILGRAAKLA
jgi:5-methyltetrahydropteroyltriglutamate--homocysteine methyltransferase